MNIASHFIPPKTRAELASPALEGQRHHQMIKIAIPLIGAGLSPQAVFAELRSKYDETVSNREIEDIVAWTVSKNPHPNRNRFNRQLQPQRYRIASIQKELTPEACHENVERFLKGFRCEEVDLWETSPWRLDGNSCSDIAILFGELFTKTDYVNIVSNHNQGRPVGAGTTLLRDEWIERIKIGGIPQCEAGAWFRFNPVAQKGSGKGGAICDADIRAYRHLLIESDTLPLEIQTSFLGKVSFPITALIGSGGKSIHALLRMDCTNGDEFTARKNKIFETLKHYGFDPSVGNGSRMTRLPGATRKLKNGEIGSQRLLFVNRGADKKGILK